MVQRLIPGHGYADDKGNGQLLLPGAGSMTLASGGGAPATNATVPAVGVGAATATGSPAVTAGASPSTAGVAAASAVGTPTVSTGASADAPVTGVSANAQAGAASVSASASPSPGGVAGQGQVGSTDTSTSATPSTIGVSAGAAVGVTGVSAGACPAPLGVGSSAQSANATPLAGAKPNPDGVEAVFETGETELSGAAVYPHPSLVAVGVKYGPSGNEFTGTYIGGGMSAAQDAMLTALAKIHGLVPGVPLVVTQTSRTAGDVSQAISEDRGVVTIERA